ncbi:ornithine carbamoyltransferase [Campylobacter pinnipediorum subsp. caledonicus]|uniref:ornithine carbamoyltransferase n=1 Tax=Campylobacter pinnipediorum TaxID=1965231 RepID=UPI0009953DE9|nr:ornithine carbamoyltransferase [Campylobacter pinnipediorum]AQW86258.1 hypothetical protein CPIN18020_1064 [Campylobacter pinnipediorum subsp. caledonicus]OPA71975.1 ornithine carbamoyltransferase [Campylobacter pinnipediorum subsp. caledonicus]
MKISFECECIILQKTMFLFCSEYVSERFECDFIVSDKKIQTKKPLFLIGTENHHINLPFTKKTLINTLEEFYSAIQVQNITKDQATDTFEEKLDILLNNFKQDIVKLIQESKQ